MRTFGVVVDSTTNNKFSEQIFKDASIVSLSFMVGEKTFNDGELPDDLPNKQAVKVLAPTPEQFIKAFDQQRVLGYQTIICLLSAGRLSDAVRNAVLAKTIQNDENIIIIDTKTFGPGIHYLLEMLDYYNNKQLKLKDILMKLEEKIASGITYLLTDNISKISILNSPNKGMQVLTKLLPIYYALTFDGGFKVIKHVFGKSSINNFLKEIVSQYNGFGVTPYVKIMHTSNIGAAKILQHEIHTKLKDAKVVLYGEIPQAVAHILGKYNIGVFIGNNEE